MSTLDDVMRRVRKLLKLSRSDNPNEAAAAAAQAQKLLLQHGLEASELEGDESAEQISFLEKFHERARLDKWAMRLAGAIAEVNQCRVLINTVRAGSRVRRSLRLVGHASDLAKARYLFDYYAAETRRLSRVHGTGCTAKWRDSFRHGVVDTLSLALYRARREVRAEAAGSKALIRVDNRSAEVDRFVQSKVNTKSTVDPTPSNADVSARIRGQIAGRDIAPTEARAALDGGAR